MQSRVYLLLFVVVLAVSCASRGSGPQGGPKDTIPPQILSVLPEDGALEVSSQEIQMRFDEYITLNNPTEQILISPPQQAQPIVKAIGKRLSLTLQDSLLPNTTYSIYFGSAIQDNNEKNPLKDITLSFSTGSTIDSLEISGDVIFAQTLLPAEGTLVGIHPFDAEDSIVFKTPFLRIAKTDKQGHFTISHVKEGMYRIYAIQDSNRTYTYHRGEPIAFLDTVVTAPASDIRLRLFVEPPLLRQNTDSLAADSITSDSLLIDSLKVDSLLADSLQRDSVLTDSIPAKQEPTIDSTATATLRVHIEPLDTLAFLQLLTDKDVPLFTQPADEKGVLFEYLKGGTYMLRLFIDLDGDSLWTTGDLLNKQQPESMYYFPKKLKIKDNWDFEETFRWQDAVVHPQ